MRRLQRVAVGLLTGLVAVSVGCSSVSPRVARERKREKALRLIDEGHAQEQQGNLRLALERYNRSVGVTATPAAYFSMGRIFEADGRPAEASAAYQEALRLAPDYQEARYAMLALGYQPAGEKPDDQTLAAAREWAGANPIEVPLTRTGDTLTTGPTEEELAARREGLLAEAAQRRLPTQAEVRTAIFSAQPGAQLPSATDPAFPGDQEVVLGSYQYHYRKAQQLGRRQQYEAAAIEYDRAMRADAKQIDARLDLGDMMLRLERLERARFHYERAMQDFPQSPRPHLKMGNYYLATNRRDDARTSFRKAVSLDPNYTEAYNNLGVMAMQDKNWNEARSTFDEILKIGDDYANAHLNRGIIASDIDHDPAAALKHFRRYVELGGPRVAQVNRWIRELERDNPALAAPASTASATGAPATGTTAAPAETAPPIDSAPPAEAPAPAPGSSQAGEEPADVTPPPPPTPAS